MRETAERIRKKKVLQGRLLKAVLKLAVVCLVFVTAIFVSWSIFRIKTITVENYTIYSDEEIIQKVMTEKTDKLSILFWLRMQSEKEIKIPFVERIDLELVDRNTILLTAYNKLVTGCVKVMGGYMYFDKDGMVVECSSELIDKVPLITGLKFDQVVLYEMLKVQKDSLFNTILDLTRLVLKYELPVTEIAFQSNYEVILTCKGHRVLLGKQNSYEFAMGALSGIVDSLKEGRYQLDMRNYHETNQNVVAKPLE